MSLSILLLKVLAALAAPKRNALTNRTNESPVISTPPVKTAAKQGGTGKKQVRATLTEKPGRRGLSFNRDNSNCIRKGALDAALGKKESGGVSHNLRRIKPELKDESSNPRCLDLLENQVRNSALHRTVDI